ncbi:MAG TPA: GNAT family N-acetyltransferase [Dongiaceae bacterium]|nr:GNAT family N-acetyltransferase [Dongiaceae bacterium]
MTAIRALGPFDLQLLAALHERSFTAPWDQAWPAASFAEILAMPGAGGWLISAGDQPAGFILLRKVVDEMEIILIASDPAWRRQGLAGRLLDHVLAEARQAGVKTAFLEQAAPNLAAQQLYAGRGFHPVGRRRGYYRGRDGVPVDAVILRRDLDA